MLTREGFKDVYVFADHLVKHSTPLVSVDVVQSAKDLRQRGCADAIIITGQETGAEADPERAFKSRGAR